MRENSRALDLARIVPGRWEHPRGDKKMKTIIALIVTLAAMLAGVFCLARISPLLMLAAVFGLAAACAVAQDNHQVALDRARRGIREDD